jgi:hypothetical protein
MVAFSTELLTSHCPLLHYSTLLSYPTLLSSPLLYSTPILPLPYSSILQFYLSPLSSTIFCSLQLNSNQFSLFFKSSILPSSSLISFLFITFLVSLSLSLPFLSSFPFHFPSNIHFLPHILAASSSPSPPCSLSR